MASTRVTVLLVVIVVLAATITTEAQQLPSCLQKLIPCFEYLNYTGELAPCCDGLKEVTANEVPCLCEFARAHGLLSYSKVVGDDLRSPYDLPRECGVSDTIPCNDDKDDDTDDAAPPPVVEHSTPNGAGRMIARTAISSLLLFSVLLMML
ncbi:lipid transfer-like protein VAS [Ipomoea triloba]|uniref:lipid transfer-like protein VAS n=1 Tax=Ipomoea triloba TaxID=35885 RepID=UPI00125D732B|nr:lipid transfer-like protein VAS [Ipomoea triloba]